MLSQILKQAIITVTFIAGVVLVYSVTIAISGYVFSRAVEPGIALHQPPVSERLGPADSVAADEKSDATGSAVRQLPSASSGSQAEPALQRISALEPVDAPVSKPDRAAIVAPVVHGRPGQPATVAFTAAQQEMLGVQGIRLEPQIGDLPASLHAKTVEEPPLAEPEELVVQRILSLALVGVADPEHAPVDIDFNVPRLWFAWNQVDPARISLYRLAGDWQKLDTEYLGRGTESHFYTAHSPGLSTFAVGVTAP